MSTTRINTYEGLFLFPASISTDLESAANHVKELLARADAEILSFSKWEERRLAYDIKGNKRGVYFLTYFKADAERITAIEHGCNLSEALLRGMVTRADHITDEQIEAADGQAELADEIKLRAEAPETETTSTTVSSAADRTAKAPSEDAGSAEAPAEAGNEPSEGVETQAAGESAPSA